MDRHFWKFLILFADMRNLGWIWAKVIDGFVFSVGSLFHGKEKSTEKIIKNQFSLVIRNFSFADVRCGCQVCRLFFLPKPF